MKTTMMQRIFSNIGYKVASLVLAVAVWMFIQAEQVQEVNREITINIQVAEGYAIRGSAVRTKAATLRGPRVLMSEIPAVLETTVAVPKGKTGTYRVRINKDNLVGWDDRIQMTVHEPFLAVYVDERITRIVPVKEILQGTPADGVLIKSVDIKPQTVTLTGVRSDLLKVRHVATEPIDITGVQATKTYEVGLIKPPGVELGGISSNIAQVSLRIGDSMINKRYSSIPVEVEGADYQASVRPATVSIVIQGTPGVLNFIKDKDLRAFVQVREQEPGRYEKDIKVMIPPDTVLIETFPERVSVTLSSKKKKK